MRQYIGGVIAERNILSPPCLLVEPFNLAFASGDKNYTLKLQITPDRHSSRLMLIYRLLPDPSHFSLLSTYKALFCHSIWHPLSRNGFIQNTVRDSGYICTKSYDISVAAWLWTSLECLFLLLQSKKSPQKTDWHFGKGTVCGFCSNALIYHSFDA